MEIYPISSFATPYEVFRCIEEKEKIATLLESGEGPEHITRYSIIAWGNKGYVKFKNGEAYGSIVGDYDNPLIPLYKLLENAEYVSHLPGIFRGGIIGYFSYDTVRYWEKLPEISKDVDNWPDFEFFIPQNFIVYDHVEGKVYTYGDIPQLTICRDIGEINVKLIDESLDKEEYERAVRDSLEYIRAGYIFQVVISRFYKFEIKGDPMKFYYRLRKLNPSPYMFYLKFYDRRIIGSSPETLFRVKSSMVETYPIAGTRPRGADAEEDLKLETELINSDKDRAEHLMLVDLARNDIGKVCVAGSVKVPELMYIEKYSHVQHLVSRVIGILRNKMSSFDVFKATFPAGTVSGAPKPMAMKLIEKFEHYRRGPYAGGVGFFSKNGDSEFAILIRSGFIKSDTVRIQAGAGIVYDSQPHLEYLETEHKLRALKVALGVS